LSGFGAFYGRKVYMKSDASYVVGVPSYWATTIPPLQHTLIGDAVIEYQFNSLVKIAENGIIKPLAAKSWDLSPDRRIVRFKIDTGFRFSDGSYLEAGDFKRSWEEGLRLTPKSSNSSLADGLSNLKGYSEFWNSGGISGVRVLDRETLELEFEKPVRRTLQRFSGGRFSVYKIKDGKYIGTGPYTISEKDQVLTLLPNPYYSQKAPALKNVKIVVVPAKNAFESLKAKEIDAFLIAETVVMPGCEEGKLFPIMCSSGQEGMHMILNLNGLPGRVFSDGKNRLAFQALIWKNIGKAEMAFSSRGFARDPQSFLQFQAGRIADSEADRIIASGERHIAHFIEESRKKPLFVAAGPLGWGWLSDILRDTGVQISPSTRYDFQPKDFWEMYYKTLTPDIMPMGASVSDGDPDGLYHALGRNGAIFSPMTERKSVCDGMESGRELMDAARIGPHYEVVSRAILSEVPYVHLGYLYRRVAYNAEKLHLGESLVGRHNLSILDFTPK
jgi:hypothetical protein